MTSICMDSNAVWFIHRSGRGLHSTLVSTVLYLQEGASAAPTLVTTKTFGSDPQESTGWLVEPKANRLVRSSKINTHVIYILNHLQWLVVFLICTVVYLI